MKHYRHLFYKYKVIIMYSVSGTLSTLVNWVTYACCTDILPIKNSEKLVLTSGMIAWIVTLIFAYVFYKNWVFESKTDTIHKLIKEFLSFSGVRFVTGLIEVFGVPILVILGMDHSIGGIEGFGAKISISLIVTILNYFSSKLLVFKEA